MYQMTCKFKKKIFYILAIAITSNEPKKITRKTIYYYGYHTAELQNLNKYMQKTNKD